MKAPFLILLALLSVSSAILAEDDPEEITQRRFGRENPGGHVDPSREVHPSTIPQVMPRSTKSEEKYIKVLEPGTLATRCCVCLGDFSVDLKSPVNECQKTLYKKDVAKGIDNDSWCELKLVGDRTTSLFAQDHANHIDNILKAMKEKGASCSDGIFYVSEGHSTNNVIHSETELFIKKFAERFKTQRAILSFNGCRAHGKPEEVKETISRIQKDTKIPVIQSTGSQCYDPGNQWTKCTVTASDRINTIEWYPCHSETTQCSMSIEKGNFHRGMSWRCLNHFGQLNWQYCCQGAQDEKEFVWTKPQSTQDKPPCLTEIVANRQMAAEIVVREIERNEEPSREKLPRPLKNISIEDLTMALIFYEHPERRDTERGRYIFPKIQAELDEREKEAKKNPEKARRDFEDMARQRQRN